MSDVAAASAAVPVGRAFPGSPFLRDIMRYGACSAAALALDWGVLIGLARLGFSPLCAAAAGFCLGMALTYVLSITVVYADRRNAKPWREAVVFVAIGIAGLGVNQVSLWTLMACCALSASVAKAPTAGMVFLFNFLLRRALLFSRPAP